MRSSEVARFTSKASKDLMMSCRVAPSSWADACLCSTSSHNRCTYLSTGPTAPLRPERGKAHRGVDALLLDGVARGVIALLRAHAVQRHLEPLFASADVLQQRMQGRPPRRRLLALPRRQLRHQLIHRKHRSHGLPHCVAYCVTIPAQPVSLVQLGRQRWDVRLRDQARRARRRRRQQAAQGREIIGRAVDLRAALPR